jgi:hypothetical protein
MPSRIVNRTTALALQTARRLGPHRRIAYRLWLAQGRLGPSVTSGSGKQAAFMVTAYHLARAKNIEPIVRSALRCDFISHVIAVNHNPEWKLADWVHVHDERLRLIDRTVRRGPGARWLPARDVPAEYFIAQDDDRFFFPAQLRTLFEQLVRCPDAAHGLLGRRDQVSIENREARVDVLYSIYGITRAQLDLYFERLAQFAIQDPTVAQAIERCCDDICISTLAAGSPYVHRAGLLLPCPTTHIKGVALHSNADFYISRKLVWNAMMQHHYCRPDIDVGQ